MTTKTKSRKSTPTAQTFSGTITRTAGTTLKPKCRLCNNAIRESQEYNVRNSLTLAHKKCVSEFLAASKNGNSQNGKLDIDKLENLLTKEVDLAANGNSPQESAPVIHSTKTHVQTKKEIQICTIRLVFEGDVDAVDWALDHISRLEK